MDNLVVPFMFVPDGAVPDTDWLAQHPNWVKIPATMVWRYADEEAQSAGVLESIGPAANPSGIADERRNQADAAPSLIAARAKWDDTRVLLSPPNSSASDTQDIEIVRWTTDVNEAARGLGMSRRTIGRAIHRLKDGLGLHGDDNLLIEIPSGDVYFNGEHVGNLGDE